MSIVYIFLTTVGIVGVIGNLIVTSVYIHKDDKATSPFFILVLAFSDLIVCSILVPSTIYIEASNFQIDSVIICKAHYFITTTIVPNSCFLMVSIAFDRYFCICKVIDSSLFWTSSFNLFRFSNLFIGKQQYFNFGACENLSGNYNCGKHFTRHYTVIECQSREYLWRSWDLH